MKELKLTGRDYLVVGDVTGYGKTLVALHAQAPHLKLVGLGDLVDRGPNSKLALDYFIDNGFASVMGNHDHMMWYERFKEEPGVNRLLYIQGTWTGNGGDKTLESFGFPNYASFKPDLIDQKYWDFLDSMPLKIEIDGRFVLTHAPIGYDKRNFFDFRAMNRDYLVLDRTALWNRTGPIAPSPSHGYEGKVQLYGHNSRRGVLWHTEKLPQGQYKHEQPKGFGELWGVCLDTWREGYLSAIDLSTMQVYRQDILPEER
jgi:hypothetical protein